MKPTKKTVKKAQTLARKIFNVSPRQFYGILQGVRPLVKGISAPKSGEEVIWIWQAAGQISNGDYFRGQAREGSLYLVCETQPSHWMPWPLNWNENFQVKKERP